MCVVHLILQVIPELVQAVQCALASGEEVIFPAGILPARVGWQQWLTLSCPVGPVFNSTTKCFRRSSAAPGVAATVIIVCPMGTAELGVTQAPGGLFPC